MVIIGGGYIAVEFADFLSIGTDVTMIQRGNRLTPNAEPEISEVLQETTHETDADLPEY